MVQFLKMCSYQQQQCLTWLKNTEPLSAKNKRCLTTADFIFLCPVSQKAFATRFHEQKNPAGYHPWGFKELDTTERLTAQLITKWKNWPEKATHSMISTITCHSGKSKTMETIEKFTSSFQELVGAGRMNRWNRENF